MNRILLVDDNCEIQDANREYLTSKGYQVDLAMSGAQALALLQSTPYDCVVLDVMLPDLDGFSVCAAARHGTNKAPIIFLSCLDSEDHRISGLMAGGDDYMTKPYSVRELAVRIYAQIRRNRIFDGVNGTVNSPQPGVVLREDTRTIAINGINLIMSRSEYDVISLLLDHARETVSKAELLRQVGGEESTLFTAIRRIRAKLATDPSLGQIRTIFSEGYKYIPSARARPGL